MNPEGPWQIDPTRLPQQVELDLPAEVMDWLQKRSAQSGRSVSELILELIDQGLQQRRDAAHVDDSGGTN
jgi:hypothetical protein